MSPIFLTWLSNLFPIYLLNKEEFMSEFKQGIFNLLKLLGTSSLALALIYTLGHIIIAMSVVSVMTGASLWEAGAVALIEPSINGVWFYVLHKIWRKFSNNPKAKAFDD